TPGVVKALGPGDDDLIARRGSLEDLDLRDTLGAQANRPALGDSATDQVGKVASTLIHERASIHHQHVVATLDEDAHPEALALAQARRLLPGEAHPRRDI